MISSLIVATIINLNTNCYAKYVIEHIEKAMELEIDRTSPALNIEYIRNKNKNIKSENIEIEVKIISNEEIQETEGWDLLEDKKTLIKKYDDNINEVIKIQDLSGNISEMNIMIDSVVK